MSERGCIGSTTDQALDVLRRFAGPGSEVEVRDHGPQGVWVEGPADLLEQLGPAWASALGTAVRGWVVRVSRRQQLVRTEVCGLRWDPVGNRSVVATSADEDEDGFTPPDEIARERLQIVLDLYERLHEDDARVERWRVTPVDSIGCA